MTKKEKMTFTLNYLEELFPDAHCELNYSKPYELLIAVMLSAQTTDKAVNEVTANLFSTYPSLNDLANAKIGDVENIIKRIGLYKAKAKRVIEISNALLPYNGDVPHDENILLQLPGVGNKTKNVVYAELFDDPVLAVDTHVARVAKRLGFVELNDSPDLIEEKLEKLIPIDMRVRAHHRLIFFGRYHCFAKNPKCECCILKSLCKVR